MYIPADTISAWVPNSEYESIYIPNAFIVDNNIISYDLYFIAPEGPDAPTIVFLEDVPNDQGGQLELANSNCPPWSFGTSSKKTIVGASGPSGAIKYKS